MMKNFWSSGKIDKNISHMNKIDSNEIKLKISQRAKRKFLDFDKDRDIKTCKNLNHQSPTQLPIECDKTLISKPDNIICQSTKMNISNFQPPIECDLNGLERGEHLIDSPLIVQNHHILSNYESIVNTSAELLPPLDNSQQRNETPLYRFLQFVYERYPKYLYGLMSICVASSILYCMQTGNGRSYLLNLIEAIICWLLGFPMTGYMFGNNFCKV